MDTIYQFDSKFRHKVSDKQGKLSSVVALQNFWNPFFREQFPEMLANLICFFGLKWESPSILAETIQDGQYPQISPFREISSCTPKAT